jgi:adenine-specific DNA-methyltransferase
MLSLNYIGSKKKILKYIEQIISDNIGDISDLSFADLFAGTGIVGYNFRDKCKFVISNDLEYYSAIINKALLSCTYSDKLSIIIEELNNLNGIDGLIYKNFSPDEKEYNRMFWTIENSRKADHIIQTINYKYNSKDITKSEKYFLIASLLVSIDKVANTSCVYGAFLKKFKKSALKKLILFPIHTDYNISNKKSHIVHNDYIENIASEYEYDIVYLDPPYNTRQYASNYSPLNYIAYYDKNAKIKGKTGLLENYNKSNFSSKTKIKKTFKEIINNIKCKYLLLSYNNEGILNKKDIKDILIQKGNVILYKIIYNKFKSNKNVSENKVIEYLWVVNCIAEKNNSYEEIDYA